jgi:CHAD domain-containing protein
MQFFLKRNEGLGLGLKRVSIEQVQVAIDVLTDPNVDHAMAVHIARKACKMLRGLIRLVRTTMNTDYAIENACFRDAAARLSSSRDTEVLVQTINRLSENTRRPFTPEVLSHLDTVLIQQRENHAMELLGGSDQVAVFLAEMHEVLHRIPNWSFADDLDRGIQIGFKNSYRQGRWFMNEARQKSTDASLHRWRKYVKYHEYQMRLLRKFLRGKNSKRIECLGHLSEVLGDDHDLAVLQKILAQQGDDAVLEALPGFNRLCSTILKRRDKLQCRAFKLGRRLYRSTTGSRLRFRKDR